MEEHRSKKIVERIRDAIRLKRFFLSYGEGLARPVYALSQPQEIAIVSDSMSADTQALLDVFCIGYRHFQVVDLEAPGTRLPVVPLLRNRGLVEGQGEHARRAAYLCRAVACQAPVTDPLALEQLLGARWHCRPDCVALNLLLLGCLELARRVPATAHQHLEESVGVYRKVGPKDDLGLALACLSIAASQLGDTPGARQHLCHALEIAQESGTVPPLLWALPATALLLVGQGEKERAVELYALALRFPLVAKSRWFADVAANTLAEVAATLPAGRVTVLQERGRTRDLEATVAEILTEL
jgi:hypothetical protein